jgi:hypothetical protein
MKEMRAKRSWRVASAAVVVSLSGCGGTEVKLADVPPAKIEPVKVSAATKDRTVLKSGAPAKGSSSGINFNPSETPPPR